jgi:hypothetical protein
VVPRSSVYVLDTCLVTCFSVGLGTTHTLAHKPLQASHPPCCAYLGHLELLGAATEADHRAGEEREGVVGAFHSVCLCFNNGYGCHVETAVGKSIV